MSERIEWQVDTEADHTRLRPKELDLILAAQRELIYRNLGVFGLTTDLEFLFASNGNAAEPLGVLAWRPNGEEVWVQIVYVDPDYRQRGCFAALMAALESQFPDRKIGFAVRPTNVPMIAAMHKFGCRQDVLYFYRNTPKD